MPELKLGKLPDPDPVKITVTVSPELGQALRQYAKIYQMTYGGEAESVAELIPFMLDAFLESDRGFAKARKEVALDAPPEPGSSRRIRPSPSLSASTTNPGE